MKEKLEKLFEAAEEFHAKLRELATELDSSDMWDAEGSMQDVKSGIREQYSKLD